MKNVFSTAFSSLNRRGFGLFATTARNGMNKNGLSGRHVPDPMAKPTT